MMIVLYGHAINKYYNQTIVDITGSDYNYNIKIRKIK